MKRRTFLKNIFGAPLLGAATQLPRNSAGAEIARKPARGEVPAGPAIAVVAPLTSSLVPYAPICIQQTAIQREVIGTVIVNETI